MDLNKQHEIKVVGGLYLVLDPSIQQELLLSKLKSALKGGVGILQIWNNWPVPFEKSHKIDLINRILEVSEKHDVPVLINNEWDLVKDTRLSGIHFDKIPNNFDTLKAEFNRELIIGVTSGNKLATVEWADKNKIDYISFCSLFPSRSAGVCEIVTTDTILKARKITQIPLFVSGGITNDNLLELQGFGISGVAVISGILDAASPNLASEKYIQTLNKILK